MNRIDMFADALTGWLNEYAEKQNKVYKLGECGECAGSEQKQARMGASALVSFPPPLSNEHSPEPTADDGGDCGPYEGEYEAAVRMSPHPECCACEDCNLKHRYEEEA